MTADRLRQLAAEAGFEQIMKHKDGSTTVLPDALFERFAALVLRDAQAPAEGDGRDVLLRQINDLSRRVKHQRREIAILRGHASKAQPKLMASDVWEIGKQVWPSGGPTLIEQSKFADLIERKLERIAAPSPAPAAESSGARLALCPFCGRRPVLTVRPDNAEATSYFAAVACFCDGYAACAHKDATAAEADEAERLVREKWNRRATVSPAVAHQPETALSADNTAFLKLQQIIGEAGSIKGYWPGDSDRVELVVKLANEVIDLLMQRPASGDITHAEYIALTNPGALKPLEVGFGPQETKPPVQGSQS